MANAPTQFFYQPPTHITRDMAAGTIPKTVYYSPDQDIRADKGTIRHSASSAKATDPVPRKKKNADPPEKQRPGIPRQSSIPSHIQRMIQDSTAKSAKGTPARYPCQASGQRHEVVSPSSQRQLGQDSPKTSQHLRDPETSMIDINSPERNQRRKKPGTERHQTRLLYRTRKERPQALITPSTSRRINDDRNGYGLQPSRKAGARIHGGFGYDLLGGFYVYIDHTYYVHTPRGEGSAPLYINHR
ncbi:hypothetical protein F4779DRAFT_636573 [Xylariaceae sp. FL0662B]|nr:hypothetical protein F4779DRAFT_636573 [Xylariaceae sp. FL0662B]